MKTRATLLLLLATLGAIVCVAGCQRGPAAAQSDASQALIARSPADGPARPGPIIIDGDISDWPADRALLVDEHQALIRFTIEGEPFSLQAAREPTALLFDLDASTATGLVSPDPRLSSLGVDLEIVFSPPGRGRGVAAFALDSMGTRTNVPLADLDFVIAPTFASPWYEARITRVPAGGHAFPTRGLFGVGRVSVVVALLDDTGAVVGASPVMTADADVPCTTARRRTSVEIPRADEGVIRVVSYNVERSKPVRTPRPFADVLGALRPHVVLIQEWEEGDAEALRVWFDTHVPPSGWHVAKPPGDLRTGGAVAVVSRFPLTDLRPSLRVAQGPVRFAAARLDTPAGPLLAASLHLKCCGSDRSREETERRDEARAINQWLARNADGIALRVVGGDVNLVGTRVPLDLLRARADVDATDLTPAAAMVQGDPTFYTWRGSDTFAPARLDWILYSDASLTPVGAWTLDTQRLGEAPLALMGLRPESTDSSDHLPVVVDLKPAR